MEMLRADRKTAKEEDWREWQGRVLTRFEADNTRQILFPLNAQEAVELAAHWSGDRLIIYWTPSMLHETSTQGFAVTDLVRDGGRRIFRRTFRLPSFCDAVTLDLGCGYALTARSRRRLSGATQSAGDDYIISRIAPPEEYLVSRLDISSPS